VSLSCGRDFGAEETHVEAGVERTNQRTLHRRDNVGYDVGKDGRNNDIVIANTMNVGAADRTLRINQSVENDPWGLAGFHAHDRDLDDPGTGFRRKARGPSR
jgi:hypothetical protein